MIRSSENADNLIVTNGADVPKDRATHLADLGRTRRLVAPIENKVIGHLAGATSVTRTNDDSGESPLGNLIADAQKADASTVTGGKTPEIAFMNPGGIRADLQSDRRVGHLRPGVLGAAVQQLRRVHGHDRARRSSRCSTSSGPARTPASPKILQVSGITYSYAQSGTSYTLDPASVKVNGAAARPGPHLPGGGELVPVRRG